MAKFQLLGEAPAPGIYQNYTTQKQMFGYVAKPYKKPNRWRHLVPLRHWVQWTGRGIVLINRDLCKYLAETWHTTLTQVQRDAWMSAAQAATWTNYYGHPAFSGGFELWMRCQRDYQYYHFWPWLGEANIAHYAPHVPPTPWTPAPAPHIVSITNYSDAWTAVYTDNNPDSNFWETVCLVSQARGAFGPGRPKSYLVAPCLSGPIPPHDNNINIPLEYPHFPAGNGPANRLKLGIRFFNPYTMMLGLTTWTNI